MAMSESEFSVAADRVLAAIEAALDRVDIDAECHRSGSVLTVETANGARIVINSQAPMQQIWLAAPSGGHHFAWSEGQWRDTRDSSELFAALSRVVSQHSGAPVVLRP